MSFSPERRGKTETESCFLFILSLTPQNEQKNAENNKKKGGGKRGGGKRDDSDSDDDDDGEGGGASPSSSKSSSSGGGGGGSNSSGGGTAQFDLEATKAKMAAAVERLRKGLSGLHAGRATPSMLEHVPVTLVSTDGGEKETSSSHASTTSSSSSSTTMPLLALAAVTARDANTLVVTPFDPSPTTAAAIVSALRLPPLKLDARIERSGELVVPVPRATPEAVAALAKVARSEAEAARVALRAARKEGNAAAKAGEEAGGGEDARRRNEKAVQAAADEFSKKVDAALAAKEADLAAV